MVSTISHSIEISLHCPDQFEAVREDQVRHKKSQIRYHHPTHLQALLGRIANSHRERRV